MRHPWCEGGWVRGAHANYRGGWEREREKNESESPDGCLSAVDRSSHPGTTGKAPRLHRRSQLKANRAPVPLLSSQKLQSWLFVDVACLHALNDWGQRSTRIMQCSCNIQSLFSVNEYDRESKKGMLGNDLSMVKQGIGVWTLIFRNWNFTEFLLTL
jgi:hypothetical protein